MEKRKITKEKLLRSIMLVFLTFGFSVCSLFVGSFTKTSITDVMTISLRRERKKDKTDFTYIEAVSTASNNLFNDVVSSKASAFDNYWHFDNRPDIYAFRKWDQSIDPNTNDVVYPLSFNYEIEGETQLIELPILSIMGSKWEGELSHLSLEVTSDNYEFDLKDKRAIQNSVILSYSVAEKMSPENVDNLIGTTIVDNVLYTNPFYKPAHYNNSSESEVISEVNIAAIFTKESSERMARFMGNDFVFMYGGTEGAYNHSGPKIGCHLSTDDYANYVALSQLLLLDNDKSELEFYNYKNNQLVDGELQATYLNAKATSESLKNVSPILFCLLLVVLGIVFWFFVFKKRTVLDAITCGISFVFFALIIALIKMINLGKYYLVFLTPIGCSVFLLVSIVVMSLLLVQKKSNTSSEQVEQETDQRKTILKTILSYVVSFASMLSLYVVLYSLTGGKTYFLLPAAIISVGMFFCLIRVQPKFCFLNNKIYNKAIQTVVSFAIPFAASFITLIPLVGLLSLIIPNFKFSIVNILFVALITIVELLIAFIVPLFKKKKEIVNDDEDYTEISI